MTIQSAMDTGQVGESQITAPGVKDLADLKRMFNDYQSSMEANRIQCLIDDDYYHAKQLTPNEKETLQRRGQPDIVVNRTRVGVNGVLGVMIQSKTDPKCWPRTEMDDPASDVSTDVLRYAIDESRWTKEKSYCVRDYLIQGTAAVIVGIDANKKPTITQIRWEEFFADPRSRRPDFKDAAYMGIAKWMYLRTFRRYTRIPMMTSKTSWKAARSASACPMKVSLTAPLTKDGWTTALAG
jgi:hypothetical protein